MRPIIGVNGDCLWLCGDVCHSPPSLSAPRSHGKLRRRLTGTGVGSNFRFVCHHAPSTWIHLEWRGDPPNRRHEARVGAPVELSAERLETKCGETPVTALSSKGSEATF